MSKKTKKKKTAFVQNGRPIESRDGGKRHVRYIRFSDAEWSYVVSKAETADVTASELIRKGALRGMPETVSV